MTSIHVNRRALRADIESSGYWSSIAPTVAFIPDFLVVAWAELCSGWDDDASETWDRLIHGWPPRSLRYIDHATDLVKEYIAAVTSGAVANA
jgi:hypothetical protein